VGVNGGNIKRGSEITQKKDQTLTEKKTPKKKEKKKKKKKKKNQ